MSTNTNTNPPALVFRLYFGRARPNGPDVSDAEFRAFLAEDVGPALEGWTILEARGGWRDAATGALVDERSAVLETFGTDLDRPTVEALARRYVARFGQDAVGLVVLPALGVEFLSS